jgi:hypothetical protein
LYTLNEILSLQNQGYSNNFNDENGENNENINIMNNNNNQ